MNTFKGSLILAILLCFQSCITFHFADGSKRNMLLPVKDKIALSDLDTSTYKVVDFDLANYSSLAKDKDGKKIVVPISGSDLIELAKAEHTCKVFFWNPSCPVGDRLVSKTDSLNKKGERVLLISLRTNCDLMIQKLSNTTLAKYPLYIIEEKENEVFLAKKQINFIKEAWPSLYSKYKDDVLSIKYLLIRDGEIEPVWFNAPPF